MCNKVLSLSFGITNPNSSSFLGSVQWTLDKQLKDSEVYSIFHNATACQLLWIFENASRNLLDTCNKVFFLNFGMANLNPSSFLNNI